MTIDVLLFAQLREKIGRERLTVTLGDSQTVAAALDNLAAQHAPIAALRDQLAVAVNEKYARLDQVLQPGDVIALIPPVSGG